MQNFQGNLNFNLPPNGGQMGQFQPFLWHLGADILGTSVIGNNYVNKLHKCLTHTPELESYTPMRNSQHKRTQAQCLFLANKLLNTINLNRENIREWAILNSGATSHFLIVNAPRDDVRPALIPLTVRQPDGAQVYSLHTCSLRVKNLPQKAHITHIIPGLASHSLLSVVQLCNEWCKVVFTKIDCCVKYQGRTVLRGYKCKKRDYGWLTSEGAKAV